MTPPHIKIGIGICIFIVLVLNIIPWYALSLLLNQRYTQSQFNPADFDIESEQITLTTYDELDLVAW